MAATAALTAAAAADAARAAPDSRGHRAVDFGIIHRTRTSEVFEYAGKS